MIVSTSQSRSTSRPPSRKWGRVAIALGALAVFTAALMEFYPPRRTSEVEARSRLVAAAGNERTVEPRLTGGFPHYALTAAARSGAAIGNLSLLATAAEAQRRVQADASAGNLREYGAALVLLAKFDDAVATLEDAVALEPTTAAAWSDLGAAYFARAQAQGRAADLPRALDALERAAQMTPDIREVHFNLGLTLAALQLTEEAIEAFTRYLNTDGSSGWAEESRARVAELRKKATTAPSVVTQGLAEFMAGTRPEVQLAALIAADPREARETFETDLLWNYAASASRKEFYQRLMLVAQALSKASGDSLPQLGVEALGAAPSPALIEGLTLLGMGKRAFSSDDIPGAVKQLARARELLSASNHPYEGWAQFYYAQALFYSGDTDEPDALLTALHKAVVGRHGVLAARAAYLSGLVRMRQSRFVEASIAFREAAAGFEVAGENSLTAAARTELAESLEYLAQPDDAWAAHLWSLRYALTRPAHRLRHVALAATSRAAVRDGHLFAAMRLQVAMLHNARQWRRPTAEVEAHLRKAEIFERLGNARDSLEELSAVQAFFDDAVLRPALLGWEWELQLLRASALVSVDARAALSATVAARLGAARQASRLNNARIQLVEARASRRAGFFADAQRQLETAIELLEAEGALIDGEFERVSTSDRIWQVFAEAVDVASADARNPALALQIAERGRSLLGLPRVSSPMPLESTLANALPPHTVLVYFEPLPDRLVSWRITNETFAELSVPISRRVLIEKVARLRVLASSSSDRERYRDLAQQLYRILFGDAGAHLSAGQQLAVVADPILAAVPFAALVNPASGRYLVQERSVVVAPSAGSFLHSTSALRLSTPSSRHALLVGNPSTSSANLPRADDEVRDLGLIYPDNTTLQGSGATAAAIRRQIERAAIFHYAGHAVANPRYPRLSFLHLADATTDAGKELTAASLSTFAMKQLRLAVLAACDSAGGATEPGSPAFGLAKAFLGAGVPSVVGSLWPIADRATSELVVRFHSEYVRTGSAPSALRAAQLQFLGDATVPQQHPYFWASLQAYGGLSPVN